MSEKIISWDQYNKMCTSQKWVDGKAVCGKSQRNPEKKCSRDRYQCDWKHMVAPPMKVTKSWILSFIIGLFVMGSIWLGVELPFKHFLSMLLPFFAGMGLCILFLAFGVQ